MNYAEPNFQSVIDPRVPPDSAVVALRGIVDLMLRPPLTAASTWLVRAQPSLVCVDLGAVTYFGAEGLRFLANLARCGSDARCDVTVTAASPMARRALEVTGLGKVLQITSQPDATFSTAPPGPAASVLLTTSSF